MQTDCLCNIFFPELARCKLITQRSAFTKIKKKIKVLVALLAPPRHFMAVQSADLDRAGGGGGGVPQHTAAELVIRGVRQIHVWGKPLALIRHRQQQQQQRAARAR